MQVDAPVPIPEYRGFDRRQLADLHRAIGAHPDEEEAFLDRVFNEQQCSRLGAALEPAEPIPPPGLEELWAVLMGGDPPAAADHAAAVGRLAASLYDWVADARPAQRTAPGILRHSRLSRRRS